MIRNGVMTVLAYGDIMAVMAARAMMVLMAINVLVKSALMAKMA